MKTLPNLYDSLLEILKQDAKKRFFSDGGDLLRNAVYEAAMAMDSELIKLLLVNKLVKGTFFKDVDGILVFDKTAFAWAINNKEFLPDSYTRFKNKIGLVDNNEQFISAKNDVVLSFPYKDCVLEGGQTKEDQKRGEIFYNTILAPDEVDRLLAPKVFTNAKKYTKDGEEKITEFNETDNLLIKGNNLLAISSLLQKYEGQIKLIYLDPPYNTGNDGFNYNDNFNHSSWLTFMKNRLQIAKRLLKSDGVIFVQCDDNEQAYLKVLLDEVFKPENFVKTIHVQMSSVQGQKVKAAKEGNIVKNGEYIHVYSLNGNKKIGKRPLYVPVEYDTHYSLYLENIDNNTYREKRLADVICKDNELFKHLNSIDIGKISSSGNREITNNEIALAYKLSQKFRDFIHKEKDNIVADDKTTGLSIPEKLNLELGIIKIFQAESREYLLTINSNGNIRQRIRLTDKVNKADDFSETYGMTTIRGDWWAGYHLDMGNVSKEGGVKLENGKKPERLIKNIIQFTTDENDIVLDFFAASGTSCAVAHKMKRRWIGVEQLDYEQNDSIARLKSVLEGDSSGISAHADVKWNGGGSFIYCELKENNQQFINKILSANKDKDFSELFKQIFSTGFISYKVNVKDINENESEFEKLSIDDKKKFLVEILDKNMLYVNYCDINDVDFNISKEDKAFTKSFYGDV